METNENNLKRKRRRIEHDDRTAEPAVKKSTRNNSKADPDNSLIALLRSGSWDSARSLLESATLQNSHIADFLDENGQTVYHKLDFECVPGDLVSKLLTDPNFFSVDFNGDTPLHLSPSETICTRNAINAQNYHGQTPLHLAVLMGQKANVELLLKHGASMDIEDQLGNTPLNLLRPDITPNIATNVARVVECNVISALSASITVRHKRHENLFGQRPPLFWPLRKSAGAERDQFNKPRLAVESLGHRDLLGNTGLHVAAGVYAYRDANMTSGLCHLPFSPDLFIDSSVPKQSYSDRNIFGRTPVHEIASHPCGLLLTLGCRNAKRAIVAVDGRGRNLWHYLFLCELIDLADLYRYMDEFSGKLMPRIEALSAADVRSWEAPRHYFRDWCESRDLLGRTPLHYAAMSSYARHCLCLYEVIVLYFFGLESLTVQDIYGRTPLHYAYMYGYKMPARLRRIIPRDFIDENLQDGDGFSPKEMHRLASRRRFRYKAKFDSSLVARCQHVKHVSETIESSLRCGSITVEQVTEQGSCFSSMIDPYKVWIDQCQHGIYSGHYKATFASLISGAILSFMTRLVATIGAEDRRLIGKVIEVGSAFEGTKLDLNDEYDFTIQLTALSRLCEVSNTNDCPPGFCIVKKRDDIDLQSSREYASFVDFFDDGNNLKTVAVQFWFQRALVKVLSWQKFWDSEPLLELCSRLPENLTFNEFGQHKLFRKLSKKFDDPSTFHQISPNKLGKNIIVKFNRPLDGTFVLHPISVDIVPAVCVEGWWPADARQPADSKLRSDGCNLVFSQPFHAHRAPYSAIQYANLSFARAESLLIRHGPAVVRAAYVVAKRILDCFYSTFDAESGDEEYCRYVKSHVIKTAALWAAATVKQRTIRRASTTFAASLLQTYVELLFAKMAEFAQQDYVPSFFAPSLRFPVWEFEKFIGYTKTILQSCSANVETLNDDDGKTRLSSALRHAAIEIYLLSAAVSKNGNRPEFALPAF